MRILWITNVEMPEIAATFGRTIVVGGWMNRTSHQLAAMEEVQLVIACPINGETYSGKKIGNISYYAFSRVDSKKSLQSLIKEVHPDCIHIWGTEYAHSYDAICAAEEEYLLDKTIVSIQGLVSVYAEHYTNGIPHEVVHGRTLKELLGRPNIADWQKIMEKQGKLEIATLKKARHCIGRTDWDYACVKQINQEISYHFCNETLRGGFYQYRWDYKKCKKHSIFFSQAHYPIKGLHHLLKALPIICREFPDTEVHIVGNNFLKKLNWKEKLKTSSYEKYLISLEKEYTLEERIHWLGPLNEEQMIQQFCSANVFVCASNIENSSNSIGEAMLLGVPVVASDVGGIKSLMEHNVEGLLYQETAPYMLAACVIQLFKDCDKARKIGKNARNRALITHNEEKNIETLKDIYHGICGGTDAER